MKKNQVPSFYMTSGTAKFLLFTKIHNTPEMQFMPIAFTIIWNLTSSVSQPKNFSW